MAGYAESKGVPSARATVVGSGVLIVVSGRMVLLGVWADLGALLLVVFLVPTAVLMHGPWEAADDQDKQMAPERALSSAPKPRWPGSALVAALATIRPLRVSI